MVIETHTGGRFIFTILAAAARAVAYTYKRGKGWRASHSFGRGASGPTRGICISSALESLILKCLRASYSPTRSAAPYGARRPFYGWPSLTRFGGGAFGVGTASARLHVPRSVRRHSLHLQLHPSASRFEPVRWVYTRGRESIDWTCGASAGRGRDDAAAAPARGGSSRLGGRDDSAGAETDRGPRRTGDRVS